MDVLTMLNILGIISGDFYKFKDEPEPGYTRKLDRLLISIFDGDCSYSEEHV